MLIKEGLPPFFISATMTPHFQGSNLLVWRLFKKKKGVFVQGCPLTDTTSDHEDHTENKRHNYQDDLMNRCLRASCC